MKPRIFIAIHYLELGGAETSLIGLLHALDPEKIDVDLFVYSHQGELMKAIPPHVNLLPENKTWSMFEKPLREVLKAGQFRMFFARMKAKYLMKQFVKSHHPQDGTAIHGYLGQEVTKIAPTINPEVEYNLAISYMNPHDFWLKRVRAKKRICWIHTDYTKIDINAELELPIWGAYDHIVSISPDCTKSFLQKFPSLKDKILEMENILPKVLIEQRLSDVSEVSKEFQKHDGEAILVSVGRICEAKNYDNIPYMAAELKKLFDEGRRTKDENLHLDGSINHTPYTINHFHWYIVGPGDHSAIDALSKKLGVDDVVTFLGPSSNPYPYIKACDIYVHPSRYEGKSIVVREAQILCKPVIITNYPTAKSQINDGVDGIICELDNTKIAESIYELASNKVKQQSIIDYLQSHDYAGLNEVNKIYKLIDA